MIYNLFEYLLTEFPNYKFYLNETDFTDGDDQVQQAYSLIQETGGPEGAWYKYVEKTIQVKSYDIDNVRARELAMLVYNKLHGKFGLVLPSANNGSEVFTEVQTAQIKALNEPQYIGKTDNGLASFSTNYQIIYVKD